MSHAKIPHFTECGNKRIYSCAKGFWTNASYKSGGEMRFSTLSRAVHVAFYCVDSTNFKHESVINPCEINFSIFNLLTLLQLLFGFRLAKY